MTHLAPQVFDQDEYDPGALDTPLTRRDAALIELIATELLQLSQGIEEMGGTVSDQFGVLATNATSQSERLKALVEISRSVKDGDSELTLEEIPSALGKSFDETIADILHMSKQGVSMSYSLDDVMKEVDAVEINIKEIQAITNRTRMVALNARIEAARAGEAGQSFKVVSEEVRDLSNQISRLAVSMTDTLNTIVSGVRDGQTKLHSMASFDLSTHILAKENLISIVNGLIEQNTHLNQELENSGQLNHETAAKISETIQNLQFYDKTQQVLWNLSNMLNAFKGAFDLEIPEAGFDGNPDEGGRAADAAVAVCTLGDLMARFKAGLNGDPIPDTAATDDSSAVDTSDIELF